MKKILITVFAMVLLSACSSVKIVTDQDSSFDFSQYQSAEYFGWKENSDKILNGFDKERIEKAFASEFEKRDVEIVEKGKGDLVVSLYIVTEQKTEQVATTNNMGGGYYGGYGRYYGYGPGWGWGGGYSNTTVHEYDYTVGTLVVSVYDKKEQKLIWETAAAGEVDEDPKKREHKIPILVAKMMSKYPVKPVNK
ncbi:DUF4136 domain-containing protein [Flammeovirgaceae bacterium SG7u.111]|nr:DUF4136 domain-containing protein [Flammeovirgaceae bacterium SG7u.132]WPO37771.1 DUF4136 domain-containing protein [Flammeovirgaceae bacterium SG7u.111]